MSSRAWIVMRWHILGTTNKCDTALGTTRHNTQCRMVMQLGRQYVTLRCIELWKPKWDCET